LPDALDDRAETPVGGGRHYGCLYRQRRTGPGLDIQAIRREDGGPDHRLARPDYRRSLAEHRSLLLTPMCGFVLAYAQSGDRLPDESLLRRMNSAIRHRGPDEHGQQRLDRTVMGHRRLSIIDLAGGQQPMCAANGQVWIVFNGEIYNYQAIRRELEAEGHPVDGDSDTAVLLHAYLAWGVACLDRLNGMFAFAIYDGRTQTLFAARDRFGEKPLYVFEKNGTLYLASELKALVEAGLVDKRLDPVALYCYFAHSYVMGPRTVFRGVRRLQPGCWLLADGAGVREGCYWKPPDPSNERTDEKAIVEEVLTILGDSVKMRLVSDVPIGFFLSGGVDSSAVVALAAEASGQPLETFSIGFNEARYDEREHARYVSKRFGTRHHEFLLEPRGVDIIEQIAWHADEPF